MPSTSNFGDSVRHPFTVNRWEKKVVKEAIKTRLRADMGLSPKLPPLKPQKCKHIKIRRIAR